jgi:hypothetical protein
MIVNKLNLKPVKFLVLGLMVVAFAACGTSSSGSQSQPTVQVTTPSSTTSTASLAIEKTVLEPTATATIPVSSPTPTPEPASFAPPASPTEQVSALSGLANGSPVEIEVSTPTPQPTVDPGQIMPDPLVNPVAAGLIAEPPVKGNERWINVNLTDSTTRLVEGRKVLREIPSAYGYGIFGSDSDYFSTAPGLYWVYSKYEGLQHDNEFTGLYFQGWVGFDPSRANGFHSFLLDDKGNVVDNRLGPVSHGCVRTEDWKAVYDFAQISMPVVVIGSPQF